MKFFSTLLILICLSSCNQKIERAFHEISSEISFANTIENCNRIIIKSKKIDCTDLNTNDDCFENTQNFVAKNENQIKIFEKLFDNLSVTDYCCCPETNFKIDFYKNSKIVDTYFVDIVSVKDSVRVFEQSYQFSYIVEKRKWSDFLNEIEH